VFAPAGGTLLTANGDDTWILWDVAAPGRPRRLRTFNGTAVYAPDGRWLASHDVLWRLPGPVRAAAFDGGTPIAYDATETLLATHPTRATTTFWRVTDPAHPTRLGTAPQSGDGAFTPDGHFFAARDGNRTTLWDLRDPGRPRRAATVPGDGLLSPDGHALATDTDLWDVTDRTHPRRLAALDARPVFSHDSRSVATGAPDGGVTLYDTATGTRLATLPPTPGRPNNAVQIGASDTLTTLAFTPDDHTLTVITGNETVSVWNLDDRHTPVRTRIVTRPVAGAGRVGLSPDGSVVAGAAADGTDSLTLWRLDEPV